MRDFVRGYEAGYTPNPCIECNRRIKFDFLLDYARKQGFDVLATGHYVRTGFDEQSGRWQMRRALDESKDQSYVLAMLTQEQLPFLRFPLGEHRKSDIRELAASLGLAAAHKPDSQDICFVPDGDYGAFLERYRGRPYPAGDFLDEGGNVVGRHRGAVRYTPGQRRGLALPMGERVYVIRKDMAANTVTVGPERALYSTTLTAGRMNWLSVPEPETPIRVWASCRYRQKPRPAMAEAVPGGRLRLRFDKPQRAVTPGQTVVLYDGDLVLGGGIIQATGE